MGPQMTNLPIVGRTHMSHFQFVAYISHQRQMGPQMTNLPIMGRTHTCMSHYQCVAYMNVYEHIGLFVCLLFPTLTGQLFLYT